jgi:dTMP kinase
MKAAQRQSVAKAARGRFITLEGGEGAGKSTQARLLAEHLRACGLDCVVTREPGGSSGAEALREILLSGAAAPLGPAAEAVLFSAARIDHIRHTIRPALKAGAFVICDRFSDSTRAYQGALGNLDPRLITALEHVAVGDCRPDLTLVLDLPAEAGLARATARRGAEGADRFEGEGLGFHQTLRQAFLAIAAGEPGRCAVIDASPGPEVVGEAVWACVQQRLGPFEARVPARRSGAA